MSISVEPDLLLELIRSRRSHKIQFLAPDPVPRELVERVLEAARWAPSHGKTEPWRFTVFAGDARTALAEAFAEGYRAEATAKGNYTDEALEVNRQKVGKVPVWIALTLTRALKADGSFVMPEWEELLAFGGAVQNLHLMATTLGLSGQWSTGSPALSAPVAALIGVEPPARALGFFLLGYPSGAPPEGVRKPLAEKVSWRSA